MEDGALGVYQVNEEAGRNKAMKGSNSEFPQNQGTSEHTTFVTLAYQTLLVLRAIHCKEKTFLW